MKLVLENKDGKAIRTFLVEGESAQVIFRKSTRRVEVHPSFDRLDGRSVAYDRLGEVSRAGLESNPLAIGDAKLKLVSESSSAIDPIKGQNPHNENSKIWILSLILLAVLQGAGLALIKSAPEKTVKSEQALKQQVVQIVKRIPIKQSKPVEVRPNVAQQETQTQVPSTTRKTASIKRMGALSVFGSLKNSKQRGGVNLGAVNTTAGPGLGGTQGSGGVQSTLYGKGLVAAPLGAGSNMQGGGGYGTKGKGGGQAGYGKLSLVGSAGTASIPLGREALIEGGLDKDLISDVINRNMGQIRFCYEQGLQGDPALNGRVAIGFTISGSGQVKVASVDNTTLGSKLVEDCIVARLRSWKFPLPEGGSEVKVSYPFMLRRAGHS